jgi:hypothetical protein
MSLSSIIKGTGIVPGDTFRPAFRAILKEAKPLKSDFITISGRKPFFDSCTKHPYILEAKYDASLVGSSFDYLARFMIARKISTNKIQATENLTADKGLKALLNHGDVDGLDVEKTHKSCKNIITAYIIGDTNDFHSLICSAIFLSRLEHVYRSALLPTREYLEGWFEEVPNNINQDLTQLCNDFETEFMNVLVHEDSEVIFNPCFGRASEIVGGADADIYIDGALYDFKTIKKNGYRGNDAMQIVGYYLLDRVNTEQFNGKPVGFGIKTLGFYKARFGEIELVDVSKLPNLETHVKRVKTLFKDQDGR